MSDEIALAARIGIFDDCRSTVPTMRRRRVKPVQREKYYRAARQNDGNRQQLDQPLTMRVSSRWRLDLGRILVELSGGHICYCRLSYNSSSATTALPANSFPLLVAAPNIGPRAATTGAKLMNPIGCGTSS
jgi:hypothetical protein